MHESIFIVRLRKTERTHRDTLTAGREIDENGGLSYRQRRIFDCPALQQALSCKRPLTRGIILRGRRFERPNDTHHKGLILAVDDTPASLRLLTDILKAEGYEVRSAISGELALHAASVQPPELILLDISMPGMNGFEVCQHLKDQAQTATCRSSSSAPYRIPKKS